MRRRLFLTAAMFLLAFCGPGVAHAGKPAPYGFWPGYFSAFSLGSRWGLWAETQYRAYDFAGDLEQLLLRGAITCNLRPDAQLAAGYAYVRSEPYIPGTDAKRATDEHRPYQQLILRSRWGRLYSTHRYRVEERFLADGVFKLRFRYSLAASFCLNQKELSPGALYLSAYNEIFIHDRGPHYDRDRIYAGLGYCLSKSLRAEAGNMWQILEQGGRPQLQLMVFHTLRL